MSLEKLLMPIPFGWRVSGSTGQCVAYAETNDLKDRLDSVLGMENWNCEHYTINGTVYCRLGIKTAKGEWVYKTSAGESQSALKDMLLEYVKVYLSMDGFEGEKYEKIEKKITAIEKKIKIASKSEDSDSFKRACFTWGLGRFIKYIPDYWITIEKEKKGNYYNNLYKDRKTGELICSEYEAKFKLSQYINSKIYIPDCIKNYMLNINDIEVLREFFNVNSHLHKNEQFIKLKETIKEKLEGGKK